MSVSVRTEENPYPISAEENAILAGTPDRLPGLNWPTIMNDLIFAGIVILFFIGSAFYVRFCEKL